MTLAHTVKLLPGAKHSTKHCMSKPTLPDGGTPATLTFQGNEVTCQATQFVSGSIWPWSQVVLLLLCAPRHHLYSGFSPYRPDKKSAVWMGSGLPVRCRVSTKPLTVQSGPD